MITRVLTPVLTVALVAGVSVGALQRSNIDESFHALAVQPGAPPGQTTIPIDLRITRWSTDAERDAVMTAVVERSKKLVSVLEKMPAVGRLSSPGNVGYELRYAQKTSSGGTDRILLLTDRPVGFDEAAARDRTLDYPITVIELRVPPAGMGEGKIAVAARLTVDRVLKQIIVEDWNNTPVMLRALQRDKR